MKHLETLISMYEVKGERPLPSMVMRAIKLDVRKAISDGQIELSLVTHVAVDANGDIFCYSQEPQSDEDVFDCWIPQDEHADSEYIGMLAGWMFDFIRPQIYWKELITEII